jgi:hypothetical protein
MKILLLIFFIAATPLVAQVPGMPQKPPQMPLPSLDSLSLDSLEKLDNLDVERFRLSQDEFISYYSHGWFPTPFPASALSLITSGISFRIDDANGIRPPGTARMLNSFSPRNPFDETEQRRVLRPNRKGNRDADYEDSYPQDDGAPSLLGLRYSLNLPIPAILRVGASYNWCRSLLYADDRTKQYLGNDGEPVDFQEVSVLQRDETSLTGMFGVTIPIYGAFLKPVEDAAVASYYYVYLGASADYVLTSRITQYVQIANAKEDLRYANGLDTMRLVDGVHLPGTVQWRPNVEVAFGAGWSFGANIPRVTIGGASFGGGQFGMEFTAELFGSFPTTGIFADGTGGTLWRPYLVGVRTAIGYQWIR